MGNLLLFKSTLFCICVHVYGAWLFRAPTAIHAYYAFGLLTSYANHGTPWPLLRLTDRITMVLFWTTDFVFVRHTRSLTAAAGMLYCASKAVERLGLPREHLHMAAHLVITYAHLLEMRRIAASR
jgi:hypothetical protein